MARMKCSAGCTCGRHDVAGTKCKPGCTCARHTTSSETRKKLSEASRGRTASDEARLKMSFAKQGKRLSPEHRRNIGLAQEGRLCPQDCLCGRHSQQTRAKIAASHRRPTKWAQLGISCHACGGQDRVCRDHDHKTGRTRGFLCNNCNTALGLLGDSPERLHQLAQYIKADISWGVVRVWHTWAEAAL